jgi:hypothetical protein
MRLWTRWNRWNVTAAAGVPPERVIDHGAAAQEGVPAICALRDLEPSVDGTLIRWHACWGIASALLMGLAALAPTTLSVKV